MPTIVHWLRIIHMIKLNDLQWRELQGTFCRPHSGRSRGSCVCRPDRSCQTSAMSHCTQAVWRQETRGWMWSVWTPRQDLMLRTYQTRKTGLITYGLAGLIPSKKARNGQPIEENKNYLTHCVIKQRNIFRMWLSWSDS